MSNNGHHFNRSTVESPILRTAHAPEALIRTGKYQRPWTTLTWRFIAASTSRSWDTAAVASPRC